MELSSKERIKVIFFNARDYDIDSFNDVNINSEFEIKYIEEGLNEDTVCLAEGFDVVCIFVNDIVDEQIISSLEKYGIKLLALRCAGYNNVDIKKTYGKIHVANVPAYSPYSVAEYAMALLLTSIRRTHKAYNRTKDFNFNLNGLAGFELHGKTVGIIGTGRIGKVFAQICEGFGMNVIAYDKYPTENAGIKYVTKNELIKTSDIISIHCPLTAQNYHMIDENAISRMKKGVVLINTSRGALIDSEALIDGIKSRKIGAACLDVYEEEANIFFHDFSGHILNDDTITKLLALPNIIITSHQAFLTEEALSAIARITLKNIKQFFEEGFCENELCDKWHPNRGCSVECKKCF